MQQLISHLLIIYDNVYKENAFAVYDGYITDLDPHREQRGPLSDF